MPTYPLQLTCLGVIYGTPALAAIFVALRIYTRRKLSLRLSWDDWLIIFPTLLSIALIGPSHRHVKMWHVGVHIWDVDPNEIEPDYDEWYGVLLAFNLLNIPILPLVKASIILLLLRAGSVIEWLKKVLYAILIFTVGSALVPWCWYIFICPPQTGNTWKPRTFGNLHCMGRHRMGEMLIWVTCANLLTDVLILPIPFIIVRRMMSARLRSRLVVLTVFTCSLAVTGIGAAKIYLSYRDRLYQIYNPDWTYPIDYCISHIENNVAIIVANIPILRGLVTRWVFNFRTKATPQEREFRGDAPPESAKLYKFDEPKRKHRIIHKVLPCLENDFSSSLASRLKGDTTTAHTTTNSPKLPPRIITAGDYAPRNRSFITRLTRSRRNSLDRYEASTACEKADVLETVRSIGSLGSAPTLVDHGREMMDWKHWEEPVLSPKRSSPTLSPITPLSPVRIRGLNDMRDNDHDDFPLR